MPFLLPKPRPFVLSRMEKQSAENAEYVTNSKLARARDHHHCRICGSQFSLETHHVVPRSLVGKSLRDDPSNLLTVCHDDHVLITRHVIKLYPLDTAAGANGPLRVEKFDRDVKDWIVAIPAA